MSNLTPYEAMQHAVDIVNNSEHIKNKIAACLFKGNEWIARHNQRAADLSTHFTPELRIGQSSQFLHAEVACVFSSDFATEGASLCVTDPFCPNCAKAICEAGIAHVYIDHKGLDKDFAKRRGDDFESLSLLMMEKAGIPVTITHRKEKRMEKLINPPVLTRRGAAKGIEFFDLEDGVTLDSYLKKFRTRQPHTAWAIAKIREQNEREVGILVFEELTSGLTPHEFSQKDNLSEKYRFPVDPLNRLLFYCVRKGCVLIDHAIGCNLYPSSRALVNAVGYGVKNFTIGETKADHDEHGLNAGALLQKHGIIDLTVL